MSTEQMINVSFFLFALLLWPVTMTINSGMQRERERETESDESDTFWAALFQRPQAIHNHSYTHIHTHTYTHTDYT